MCCGFSAGTQVVTLRGVFFVVPVVPNVPSVDIYVNGRKMTFFDIFYCVKHVRLFGRHVSYMTAETP